jgi:aspartate/methionine/tyrosine aminotransferase
MSKTYGLAGLRIGWIATQNESVMARMAAMKDYTTICSSAPSEYLSELALRHGDQIADRNLQIIAGNMRLLDEFFAARADRFEWVRPTAGPIAFPRLLSGEISPFCHELVTRAGVLLLPGEVYDHPGNHFRLGFARRNMPQALSQLEQFLDQRKTSGNQP